MNWCLQEADVHEWTTKGKTILIQKGTPQNNYRPMMCLPMKWKILTAQIRKEIYDSLISCKLFPEERKECCKGFPGKDELPYIDQHNLNESKTRQKNLVMSWIDYKKADDMVPQIWIIHCLKIFKISDEIINLIEKTTKTRRVELTVGGKA